MILLSFYNTIEFYVIMAVVGAAIVAFAAKPQSRHAVTEHLLASRLSIDDDNVDPSLEFICPDNGTVTLVRHGLAGVSMGGAASIAAKSDGMNVTIEERLVDGPATDPAATTATFSIDFLPPGRYHVRYNSERTGLFAAFSLHVRPGLTARRQLKR